MNRSGNTRRGKKKLWKDNDVWWSNATQEKNEKRLSFCSYQNDRRLVSFAIPRRDTKRASNCQRRTTTVEHRRKKCIENRMSRTREFRISFELIVACVCFSVVAIFEGRRRQLKRQNEKKKKYLFYFYFVSFLFRFFQSCLRTEIDECDECQRNARWRNL